MSKTGPSVTKMCLGKDNGPWKRPIKQRAMRELRKEFSGELRRPSWSKSKRNTRKCKIKYVHF